MYGGLKSPSFEPPDTFTDEKHLNKKRGHYSNHIHSYQGRFSAIRTRSPTVGVGHQQVFNERTSGVTLTGDKSKIRTSMVTPIKYQPNSVEQFRKHQDINIYSDSKV